MDRRRWRAAEQHKGKNEGETQKEEDLRERMEEAKGKKEVSRSQLIRESANVQKQFSAADGEQRLKLNESDTLTSA